MRTSKTIKVVDIFAGPGGLGEGFSSFEVKRGKVRRRPFQIAVSAEMNPKAHGTLLLRAFFRRFGSVSDVPEEYYEIVRGSRKTEDLSSELKKEWKEAEKEALLLELGPETDRLHREIRRRVSPTEPWILIGGPPCQAYSLAGRSRNKGKKDYVPENDNRHFLYREYLKILSTFSPSIFVMENVSGILSANISGQRMFPTILADLHDPSRAMGGKGGPLYDIYPLSADAVGGAFPYDQDSDHSRFLVRAEELGVPQARHRVILLGVARGESKLPRLLSSSDQIPIESVIDDLPMLRSGLSRSPDSRQFWLDAMELQRRSVLRATRSPKHFTDVAEAVRNVQFIENGERVSTSKPNAHKRIAHRDWYLDPRLHSTLNHDTRGHTEEDLGRYLYCSAYASVRGGKSPSSNPTNFPMALAPDHQSWERGDFSNRFRVQAFGRPASTIMSHISKDGHYYIHPDMAQCRSLTVREAARVQTFPDNYFFTGARTDQYAQVGNAVPPLLARQIAEVVWSVLDGAI